MTHVLGIDLGTTNSAMAIVKAGRPSILCNKEGGRTTPSAVLFTSEDAAETVVGKDALAHTESHPLTCVTSIKRFIGCPFDSVKNDREAVPYSTGRSRDGGVNVRIKTYERTMDDIARMMAETTAQEGAYWMGGYNLDGADGTDFTPQEISALILAKLKGDAEERLGEEIKDAVITVPAYFNDAQRLFTRKAGELAGLNVLRIISEPTAAALAYGLDDPTLNVNAMIFDLGGGTFDVSLLHIEDGSFSVVATSGNNHLGGDDWDHKLTDYLAESFKAQSGFDVREDPFALQRFRQAAIALKEELTFAEQAEARIEGIVLPDGGMQDFALELPRSTFAAMSKQLMFRLYSPVMDVVRAAAKLPGGLSEVVLVGGSTRMPMVREAITQWTGLEPNTSVNPDEAVALGAAIQGGLLTGEIEGISLVDATPLSLGVETQGGLMTVLIERNTPIPVQVSEFFDTTSDNQTSVYIKLYQGERGMAADNMLLGEFKLDGLPPRPAGRVKVEIIIAVDANNIVSVIAREPISGIERQITVNGTGLLSAAEVEAIVAEATRCREADEAARAERTVENEAMELVQKTVQDLSRYAVLVGHEVTDEIRVLNTRINDALREHDPSERIAMLTEQLRELRQPLDELIARDAGEGGEQYGWTLDDAPRDIREQHQR